MHRSLSRRALLASTLAAGTAAAAQEPSKPAQAPKPRPAPISSDLVKEFVAVAHSKFDRVKEMLEETPALINATWDWGGGDFESALGAASHMGRRDIAEYLLEKGARPDIFCAVMLGQLEVVKASLAAFPDVIKTPGPHGITLKRHAEMGKEKAAEVLKLLQEMKAP
jgi:hypothetical protein